MPEKRNIPIALPFTGEEKRDGVIALSHTLGQLASLFLMCDRRDLGAAVEFGQDSPTFHPTIYIYDNFPGGIGLSRPLYEIREQVLAGVRELIRACGCEDGCPSCVGPTALAKEVALAILDGLKHA